MTGSDYSREFIRRAEKRFPEADLMVLDGFSLKTDRVFDALYSCKVYQHRPLEEMTEVLHRQSRILSEKGIIIHSFWIGGKEMNVEDMHFYYHDKKRLLDLIGREFKLLEIEEYTEFEENDSLFIIAEKK